MRTDTTTQDGEDRRLPATWEEFQRARREAFAAGGSYYASGWTVSIAEEARRRYPITKRVPRVVRDSDGVIWKLENGELWARKARGAWTASTRGGIYPSRVRTLAALLDNPFEEIPE